MKQTHECFVISFIGINKKKHLIIAASVMIQGFVPFVIKCWAFRCRALEHHGCLQEAGFW